MKVTKLKHKIRLRACWSSHSFKCHFKLLCRWCGCPVLIQYQEIIINSKDVKFCTLLFAVSCNYKITIITNEHCRIYSICLFVVYQSLVISFTQKTDRWFYGHVEEHFESTSCLLRGNGMHEVIWYHSIHLVKRFKSRLKRRVYFTRQSLDLQVDHKVRDNR